VTLLGIVFFFVLAVHNGWIGPVGRVALGAAASALLLGAGIELRRRFGVTHAALAAAGAGIGGAYVTLLAATVHYHLIPNSAGLGIAALIAAVGTALALWWKSELVAALGLIGALLAPAALALQDGRSQTGTGFAAFVLAGALVVALRQRWQILLIAAVVASLPQIVGLVAEPGAPETTLALALVFAALYLAAGLVPGRQGMPLIFGSALLAAGSAYHLLGDDHTRGVALLGIALVYGALTAIVFVRRNRDLAALLAVPAFTVGAVSLSLLLSGQPLVYAWAAEAAALAWLARRTKESRFGLWSLGYAALAAGHLLVFDAQLRLLVNPSLDRAHAIPAVLAVGAALAVIAWSSTRPDVRTGAAWCSGALALYAVSLTTLALSPSFQWGHVALAVVWSAIGLALLFRLQVAGAVVLSVGATFIAIDPASLTPHPAGWSLGVAGASLLAGSVIYDRRAARPWSQDPLALVWAIASAGFAVFFCDLLAPGHLGYALIGVAVPYVALAAALQRRHTQRDLMTALWSLGALLAAGAIGDLLDGTQEVLGWSAAAVLLAALAHRTGERRLLAVAAGFATFGLIATVATVAPPTHLFDPAAAHSGWGAALAVAVAAAAIAAAWREPRLWIAAAVLAVYGLSIAILDLVGLAHGVSDASFHTGHTLVSAFWGLLALALLYAGLTRWRSLRIAGFAVFAVALGKLFLFDLSSLSSLTRALSFLAVGAVLLAGGFVYQRLTLTTRPHHTSSGSP
jgi:uncharacterized membrane protein